MEDRETMGADESQHEGEAPLESWKAIAAYLQRDVRTAIRWEKSEGLPVHRLMHKSRFSVYAYPSELDSWRAQRVPGSNRMDDNDSVLPRVFRIAFGSLGLALMLFSAGNGGRAHSSEPGTTAEAASSISTKVVWHDAMDGFFGAPSPNGRQLSFLDWMTCNLAVWDFESETQRLLTKDGSWDEPQRMAYTSVWSPDGKHLAYQWETHPEGKRMHEVRVIENEGANGRLLLEAIEANWIEVSDWSPGGESILVQINVDGASPSVKTNRLAVVNVRDGGFTPLKSGSGFSNPFFSADGKYIVYDRPPEGEMFEADIFLLNMETKQETCLVQHPAHDFVMGWVPDSNYLLFASDRTGTNSLWSLAVKGGMPESPPSLLKRDIGRVQPLGFASDGSFFYSVMKAARDVMTMEIDPDTGRVLRQPQKAILDHEGSNQSPRYSPDGRKLAYISKRGGVFPGTNVGNALCVKSLENDKDVLFFRDLREHRIRYIRGARWYPDSQAVMIAGWADQAGFYRLDLADMSVELVLEFPEDVSPTGHEIGPDGDTLWYATRSSEEGKIVLRQLSMGEEKELLKGPGASTISLSPEGRWLAFATSTPEKTLQVMTSRGGEARILHRFEPGGYSVSHVWSPDGKYILFTGRDKVGNERAVSRISVGGGEAEQLTEKLLMLGSITIHPDGRHIAFHTGTELDSATDVWVMKDYLPE